MRAQGKLRLLLEKLSQINITNETATTKQKEAEHLQPVVADEGPLAKSSSVKEALYFQLSLRDEMCYDHTRSIISSHQMAT